MYKYNFYLNYSKGIDIEMFGFKFTHIENMK